MMEGDGIVDGVAKEPFCKMMVEWVLQVYESIPEALGKMCGRSKDTSGFNFPPLKKLIHKWTTLSIEQKRRFI